MLDKGTIVGGYRIDGTLGEGGMGVVYRATQLSLNRSIALKILSADLGDDPDFRERFRREGLLQAAIDHPHIVTVYDTGETEHGLFLAMSMVRGPTLKDMILSRELDPGRSLRLLSQVADALDTAHDVGLTHRDIKPQNILIGARDHAFLADFGLTKAPDEAGRLTATGQFVGTIDYVSPEQIQGEPATPQSDVYALTGVVCECLIGQVPFPKPTEAAVVYAHITEPPPKLTEHRPELPPAVDDVVAKGMAKNPADRPSSAGELLRELERSFGDTLQTAATPPGPLAAPEQTGVRGDAPPTQPAQTHDSGRDVAGATATSPVQRARAARTAPAAPAGSPATPSAPAAPAAPTEGRPAPAQEPERRAIPLAALAAGLGLIAAIAGFLIGGSGGEESKSAELGSSASAGTIGLSFPDGWKRVAEAPGIPGIRFSQPIVLAPDIRDARLVAGQVAASGPTLLPRTFLARLPSAPSRDDAVKLGSLEAYRYLGLTPKGASGRVTVYAAPTSAQVATVACVAPAASADDFAGDCERVAESLQLTGAKPLRLGPSDAYAKGVGAAFERLNATVAAGSSRLRRARTPSTQASASAALARAYATAGRRVSAVPAGPYERDAGAGVSASLRAVGAAYARAAAAARANDRSAYSAARRSVRRTGSRLSASLRRLEALGYQVE